MAARDEEPREVVATRALRQLPDAEAVARVAADLVANAAREAVRTRGRFSLALAGGDTPRHLYAKLAADPAFPAPQTEFFFGDERAVPPEHADSNYRMARETLLLPLRVDPRRIHRIEAERADLDAAARAYEAELVRVLGAREGVIPRLDCVLLGMGADGHMASLFPYTKALSETRRCVVANDVPQLDTRRITSTIPLIERARSVLVLVCGEAKAAALAEVLEGPPDPERLPAQRIRAPAGTVQWLCDAAAASRLHRPEQGA